MFMSEEAFKDVSHSPVEPITREPKATSRDSFQALIAPTPPPGRREVNDGLMRPVPPINKQDRGIARDQSGRSFSRSTSKFGVVEDQGRIYNNDLFRETQVEDQNTNVNTLNKPMTNRNEETALSNQRLENQKELQAARRRERKLIGMVKSNDTSFKSGRPSSASGNLSNITDQDFSPSDSSESSPDTVLEKNVSNLTNLNLNSSISQRDDVKPINATVKRIENDIRASGITSMEYDPSKSSSSDSRFERLLDDSYILNFKGTPENTRSLLTCAGPRDGRIRCYIKRNKGLRGKYPTYHLYMEEGDIFLLSARRRKRSKSSNYLISTDEGDLARDSECYFGKARSNFVGTEFTLYDDGISSRKAGTSAVHLRKEVGAVTYETNVFGTKGPRKMMVYVPDLEHERDFLDDSEGLIESFRSGNSRGIVVMKNKQPHWNEELCAYCLNFNGRVSKASVKNFQLEDLDSTARDGPVYLQFGKVEDDKFTMDYQYPLSALQSFMICLTSFDNKMACE